MLALGLHGIAAESVASYGALPALSLGVAEQRGQRDTAVTWAGGLGRGRTQFLRLLQIPAQKLRPSTNLDLCRCPNSPPFQSGL